MFNYSDLNDVEFEELCKDIMQKRLNEQLRTFCKGKDNGIDMKNISNRIIIQVKHYYKTPYSTLKSQLLKEVEKVRKLKPEQYYICVSTTLNPMQISEIYEMFRNYMENENNIVTLKEIDDFLQKAENQDIVEKHFKLWLSASNILEKIGQNDIFIDCESLLDTIDEEIKYFVKTSMYDKCLEILDGERIIVITGMPGVGKTITSKMLVLKYIEKGYKVRYTTNSDISNVKKSISKDPNLKEIILLDDCLGQHYLKMIEQKENEIISLIKYIRLHHNKILIMNSRITILNEAKNKSEELNNIIEDKDIQVYTINMDNISLIEKAKILYNHIYFNNIGEEYFEEIKKERRYINIVKHRNYNPRIIQNITKKSKIKVQAEGYYTYILQCLNNPCYIWKNEYENRIEKEDRILLLVLYSMSDSMVKYELLEKAFNRRIENENIDTSKNCFSEVIRRLNESMIKLITCEQKIYVCVLNPSVNDFLREEFYANKIENKKILENSITIDQIKRVYRNNFNELNKYIKNKINNNTICDLVYLNDNYNIYSFILTYITYLEIKDERYEYLIQKGLEAYNYNDFYKLDDDTTYEKKDVVIKLLISPLYEYYNVFKKLNDEEFVKEMICNINIEGLIDIVSIIEDKFLINSKRIPENILRIVHKELNYALNQYLEDYEIEKLKIDINELLYDERLNIEESLGYDIYTISEEEFDQELMSNVEDKIEEIAIYKYEKIKNNFCRKLSKEIQEGIHINFGIQNRENIYNYIKESLEEKKEYDLEEIMQESEDSIEKEIDKMFDRNYKTNKVK